MTVRHDSLIKTRRAKVDAYVGLVEEHLARCLRWIAIDPTAGLACAKPPENRARRPRARSPTPARSPPRARSPTPRRRRPPPPPPASGRAPQRRRVRRDRLADRAARLLACHLTGRSRDPVFCAGGRSARFRPSTRREIACLLLTPTLIGELRLQISPRRGRHCTPAQECTQWWRE